MNIRYLFLFVMIGVFYAHGQPTNVTVDLSHSNGKDAQVLSTNTSANYGTNTTMNVYFDYVSGGTNNIYRSFIYADFSGIPSNAIITSATLYLYCAVSSNITGIQIARVDINSAAWIQSGAGSITWSNQPSTTSGTDTTYATGVASTGWQTFNVKTHTQFMVSYPSLNKGWRIKIPSESGTTDRRNAYNTREAATNKPYVSVTYVLPLEVDGLVSHCSAGNDDGAVSDIVITEGSETYSTYEWFHYDMGTVSSIESGSNFANIDVSGLEDGLYLLRVTDDLGFIGYRYFLVGEYGSSTTVDFRNNTSTVNSGLFNEDVNIIYNITNSDGNSNVNGGGTIWAYNSTTHQYSALMKYKVYFDSLFDVSLADLRLYSGGHYRNASPATTDSAYVSRVTSDWYAETVTWNTRPTKTTTDRQLIPPTSPTGTVTRHDTIDLMPFVEYWQQHPDENYGVDFSLTQYLQPANAWLKYYGYDFSTAARRPSFLLTYSLPEQVTTTFVDTIGKGSISVVAPNGELPYTFLLSTVDTLPPLDTVWLAIKDTFDIDNFSDSVAFYQGKVNTHFYTFENLPPDRYFVGVYDNNGEKIWDQQVYVRPALRTADTVDIVIDGDTVFVESPATSAKTAYFNMISMAEEGGIEIEITQLDDDVVVGLNNMEDPRVLYEADFEYALEIESDGDVFILKNGSTVHTTTGVIGDKFRILKERDELWFYKNGIRVYLDDLDLERTDGFKTELHLKGPAASISLKPVSVFGAKPAFKTQHAICGENKGLLNIAKTSFHGYILHSMALKDQETGALVTSGVINYPSTIFSDIPVGVYNLSTYWTNGTYWISNVTEVVIGYKVIWVDKDNITETPFNTITIASPGTGTANSLNTIDYDEDYWVRFEPSSYGTLGYITFEIANLTGDLDAGIGILNVAGVKVIGFYSDAGAEDMEPGALPSYMGSGSAGFLPAYAPIRIIHESGEYIIKYQGQELVVFDDANTGEMHVEVTESGTMKIANTVASFCYPVASPYVKLRRTIDGGYYLANEGILNVEYDEEYNDDNLEYHVYKEDGNDIVTGVAWTISPVSYGDNRLTFSFTTTTCLANGYYILEIVNEKNEKRYLRFKIINSNC